MSNFMENQTLRDFTPATPSQFGSVRSAVQSAMQEGQEEQVDVQGASVVSIDEGAQGGEPIQPNRVGQVATLIQGQRLFADSGVGADDAMPFAGEWAPDMDTPTYIGMTEMLLNYLKGQEAKHHVTMPIRACGIDPIVFQNVERVSAGEDMIPTAEAPFAIGEGENISLYEIIEVDGDLYMSCVDSCLDREYLNSILAEATTCMKARGFYTFEMVGFRKLALEEGERTARLLNTLRLNTYEMSVLTTYLCSVQGVQVTYGTINGKACIQFTMNDR